MVDLIDDFEKDLKCDVNMNGWTRLLVELLKTGSIFDRMKRY